MKNVSGIIWGLFVFTVLASCKPQTEAPKVEESPKSFTNYKKLGDSLSGLAFTALSTTLKSVIDTAGFEKAIEFCSTKAIGITQNVAGNSEVEIMRIATKYRNPYNKAADADLAIFAAFEKQISENGSAETVLVENEKSATFYKPIIAQALCLNCHGKIGETLKEDLDGYIKTKYPSDLAIGFSEGDLRGAWKITFSK